MKTKAYVYLVAFVALFAGVAADVLAVTASEYAVVINLSGRQRMLSQKMSKEMLLVAKGVDAEANRAQLKKTAELFDSTLNGLIHGNADMGLPPTETPIIVKQLGKVQKLWSEFRAMVDAAASGGEVPVAKVAELNAPLLKDMNTAVMLYEKEAAKETGLNAGVVINLAGKQRMLSQKMSKELLLIALNHQVADSKAELRGTYALFDKTLKGLRDGDSDLGLPSTKDEAIVKQLDKIQAIWKDLMPVVERVGDVNLAEVAAADVQKLVELNGPLLTEMNAAVTMYEQAQQ